MSANRRVRTVGERHPGKGVAGVAGHHPAVGGDHHGLGPPSPMHGFGRWPPSQRRRSRPRRPVPVPNCRNQLSRGCSLNQHAGGVCLGLYPAGAVDIREHLGLDGKPQPVLQLVGDERLQADLVDQPESRNPLGEMSHLDEGVGHLGHRVDRGRLLRHPRPPQRRRWSWWSASCTQISVMLCGTTGITSNRLSAGWPQRNRIGLHLLADDGGTGGCKRFHPAGQHSGGDLRTHALEGKSPLLSTTPQPDKSRPPPNSLRAKSQTKLS